MQLLKAWFGQVLASILVCFFVLQCQVDLILSHIIYTVVNGIDVMANAYLYSLINEQGMA